MSVRPRLDFELVQGETFLKTVYWFSGGLVIKPITAITRDWPPELAAAGHGLPDAINVPARIQSVKGMTQINTLEDAYHFAQKLDANSFVLPQVNAAEFTAYTSGGFLAYTPPKDLTDWRARAQFREWIDSEDALLELTTENGGLTLGADGSIAYYIADDDTTALTITHRGVHDIELLPPSPSTDVRRLFQGKWRLSREVTRDDD